MFSSECEIARRTDRVFWVTSFSPQVAVMIELKLCYNIHTVLSNDFDFCFILIIIIPTLIKELNEQLRTHFELFEHMLLKFTHDTNGPII